MDGPKPNAFQEIMGVKEMITRKDYVGAKEKLLKLQCHFPALAEIHRMMSVCDILHSARLGLFGGHGVTDWYQVLQVLPTASERDVESQYNKLSALVKPIKNYIPAAGSALKMVEEAYSVLSNPEKRSIFDNERTTKSKTCELPNIQQILDADSWDDNPVADILTQNKEISSTSTISERPDRIRASENKNVGTSKDPMAEILSHYKEMSSPSTTSERSDYTRPNEIKNVGTSKNSARKRSRESNMIDKAESSHSCIHNEEGKGSSVHQGSAISSRVRRKINLRPTTFSTSFQTLKGCDHQGYFNFNNVKKAEDFEVGQVWAANDHEYLPRNYVRIDRIDKNPLRLHVNQLRPVPHTSYEIFLCEQGFPVVCGLFNVDRSERKMIELTMLSQMVSGCASEQVEIYPREHEVWAMYKDWHPITWCSNPEARKNSKLELVEIVEGYTTSGSLLVTKLMKVEGFKNVFKRDDKSHEQLLTIPLDELSRFSHLIPVLRLVGRDINGMFNHLRFCVQSSLDYF